MKACVSKSGAEFIVESIRKPAAALQMHFAKTIPGVFPTEYPWSFCFPFSYTANDSVRASLSHSYTCGINDGIFTTGIRRSSSSALPVNLLIRKTCASSSGSPELFRYASSIFVQSYVCSVFNRDRNRPDALPSMACAYSYTGCPCKTFCRILSRI